MSDIVHELRGLAIGMAAQSLARDTVSRAADEIERLRAEVREAFRAGFSSWAGPANVAEVEAWAKEEELEWAEWSATRCSSTPTERELQVKP